MTDQQIDEFLEMLAKSPTSARDMVRGLFAKAAPAEPFGYFRAEPFGWTDCAATDEGAIALYERPAAPAVPDTHISVQEAWEAAGGNPGIKASKADLIIALKTLDTVCDEADAAPAVPSVLKRGYGRLIQAAADLALQQYMPSDIVDDYPSKTISAAKVAKMMTQPRDRLRLLSIEVSEGAKQMLAATPAAPSQEPAVPQGPVCAALGDIVSMWDQHVPSEYGTPLHMQAKRALAGQQPVSPDMHGWCAYVGGMVAHWVVSEPDAFDRLGPDRFEAAIAGIIERRLWAMPKSAATPPAPVQEVTLTDEEIKRNWSGGACPPWGIKFARAIIAALREKEQTK